MLGGCSGRPARGRQKPPRRSATGVLVVGVAGGVADPVRSPCSNALYRHAQPEGLALLQAGDVDLGLAPRLDVDDGVLSPRRPGPRSRMLGSRNDPDRSVTAVSVIEIRYGANISLPVSAPGSTEVTVLTPRCPGPSCRVTRKAATSLGVAVRQLVPGGLPCSVSAGRVGRLVRPRPGRAPPPSASRHAPSSCTSSGRARPTAARGGTRRMTPPGAQSDRRGVGLDDSRPARR